MRKIFILTICCFSVALTNSAKASVLPTSIPAAVINGAFSAEAMHIIGVDSDHNQQLRWATWGKRSKPGTSIVLALLAKTRGKVLVAWSVEKPDGYEPQIKLISNWRYGGYPVLALTYQYGALAKQVELYGLDAKNQPKLLAEKLGEEIEWSISSQGEALVNIYSKPEGHIIPTCYHWDKSQQVLEKVHCE